jgi:aubergine-like protein
MKDTMILGYDLYHDSTMRGKTVGATVSSTDTDFTKWFSQCDLHANPSELGENLGHFVHGKNISSYGLIYLCYVLAALLKWHETNQKLPNRVLIYRDGCGDGQIKNVVNTEVDLVKKAFAKVGAKLNEADYSPKMAFTIVTKRVRTLYLRPI